MKTLNRQILSLAIPSIFANISIPLVGFVDMAVAGHLDAESVTEGGVSVAALIGALSVGSMLFDMLYWNFGFLRSGTGGITAQAYGRGDRKMAADTFSRAVGTGFGAGLMLVALQWIFIPLAFLVVRTTPEVQSLATRYFQIRIWAAPAALSLMAFKGWLIGMQDGVSPMISDLIVLIVNGSASVALAFGLFGLPEIGFDGIAVGTLFAQYTALLFCIAVVMLKYRRKVFAGYSTRIFFSSFCGPELRNFFATNGDLFVRSLCFILIYSAFTVISARYGDVLLASSSIIMKIMMFFSYFTDGFSYAGEALAGKYIGRGERSMVRKTVVHVFAWSMSIAGVFIFLNAFFSVPMFRIFTPDPDVVAASSKFIPWIVLMPLLGCPAFTWDGIYTGATATRQMRESSLLFVVVSAAAWIAGIAILNLSTGWPLLGFGPYSEGLTEANPYGFAAMHVLLLSYMVHLAVRFTYLTFSAKRAIPM